MPTFNLKIKFELEGVTSVVPEEDKLWHLKLKCGNCGEGTGKFSTVQAGEEVEVPGGRGTANLVQKCKMCERQNNVSIVESKGAEYTSENAENDDFVTMLQLDCRGVEIEEFAPMDGWTVSGPKQQFTNVDLSDGAWAEYDDQADESVMINAVEVEVEVAESEKKHKRRGKK